MTAGMNAERLQAIGEHIQTTIDDRLYWGARILVARHGETVLDLTLGTADEARTKPIQPDSVFSIFSVTKAFINVLVLRSVELGRIALTTKVVDIIPEFAGAPRDRATIYNLLTHTAGMPGVWEPAPGLYLDILSETLHEVVTRVHGIVEPGERCDYSPMVNHVLLSVILERTDPKGRGIVDILREDLWGPLGMDDTAMGIKAHMRDRHVEPDYRGVVPIKSLSRTHPDEMGLHLAESNEAPWAGGASTATDMMKFVEMLRNEGAYEGGRILSPRMLQIARQNHTGDLPNELYKTVALRAGYPVPPAYIGLGFNVRGPRMVNTQLGTLTNPETFGNYGAGSTLIWVDPVLDISFVGLTAGLLPQAANIERFQRISDMVVAAAE